MPDTKASPVVILHAESSSRNAVDQRFALVVVTDTFAHRLRALAALAVAHRLDEVRIVQSPYWEDQCELHLYEHRLCVTPTSFWFEARPSFGGSTRVQTMDQPIDSFLLAIHAGQESFGPLSDEALVDARDRLELLNLQAASVS
jgi:hypothetical protein